MTGVTDCGLAVEVAYATPVRQMIIAVNVAAGTSAGQAIELSGIRKEFPAIPAQPVVGIFSRKVPLDHPLAAGDRVEIYRPLLTDPMDTRRARAEQQRLRGKLRH